MNYLSVCSGIEAASVAWHGLGWNPVAYSEVEPFPSAVLQARWPNVPNLGDMTKFETWPDYAIDVLVGGPPCQAFSVAGLRGGMADPRGNLTLTFLGALARYSPKWVLYENVPGIFSSLSNDAPSPTPPPPPVDMECDGQTVDTYGDYSGEELHAFNCFLAGLSKLGYGWAYRVLNTEHFGVPQRRRRVFVIGYLGDWRRAAAVLFERHSLQGHHPPCRKAGQRVAPTLEARANGGGGSWGTDFLSGGGMICGADLVVPAVTSKWAKGSGGPAGDECQNLVAFRASGQDGFTPSEVSPPVVATDGGGAGVPTVFGFDSMNCGKTQHGFTIDGAPPLVADGGGGRTCVGFSGRERGDDGRGYDRPPLAMDEKVGALDTVKPWNVATQSFVRRLTPRECERLQGFPDDYSLIDGASDNARYKAIGNSFPVPVVRWIGQRIQANHERNRTAQP